MASFLNRIKKIASGVYHQATPFDGGQTYSTVARSTPVVQPTVRPPSPVAPIVQAPRVQNTFKPVQNSPSLVSRLWGAVSHATGDVVKPIAHVTADVVKPVVHVTGKGIKLAENIPTDLHNDVVKPIVRSPQNFINDVSDPVDREVEKSGFGRGLTAVSLGALRSVIGTGQGLSGLYDLISKGKGTNKFSKYLNKEAKATDATANDPIDHYNPGLYHGAQTATDLLQFAVGAGEAKAGVEGVEQSSKVGKGLALLDSASNKIHELTEPLAQGNKTSKVAAAIIRSSASPGNIAGNIGFTSDYMGQQASKGTKVTPGEFATNVASGTALNVGGAALGALTKRGVDRITEATPKVIQGAKALLKDKSGAFSLSKTAENHPAVRALDQHLKLLNQVRDNLVAKDAPQHAIKANAKAYTATLQAKSEAINSIKQGGYLSWPESDKLSPDEFKAEATKRLNAAADTPFGGDKPTNGSSGRTGTDKTLSNRVAKEYQRNPEKFIDTHQVEQQPASVITDKLRPDTKEYVEQTLKNAGVDPASMTPSDTAELATVVKKAEKLAGKSPAGPEHIAQTIQRMATRPDADLQTQIEAAHNAGDTAKAKKLEAQLPDQAENPDATPLSKADKQKLIADARKKAAAAGSIELKGGVKPPSGSIADVAEYDNLVKGGKDVPPALKQRLGIELSPSEKATAIQQQNVDKGMGIMAGRPTKPADARMSDSEWDSLVKSGINLEPSTVDQVIANSGGTPEGVRAGDAKREMYNLADQRAYTFLKGGGSRNEAIEFYKGETGATDKMAKYRLNMLQHEINTKVPPKTINPIEKDIPKVAIGDYQKARGNVQLAVSDVNVSGKIAIDSIKALSKKDKQRFADLVEHPDEMKGTDSKALHQAVADYRDLADRVEASSKSLGGDIARRENYYHHAIDLSNPDDKAKLEALIGKKVQARDPGDFLGINQMPRIFSDIRSVHEAGFHLEHEKFSNRKGVYKTDPVSQVKDYVSQAISGLKKQALVKGFTEADEGMPKTRAYDLKNGSTIPLSDIGKKEIKNFDRESAPNAVHKGYRATNRFLKRTLLSVSQFHPININALQAAPSLVGTPKDWLMGEGHPILAAKGLVGSARALFDKKYATGVLRSALKDGTIDFGARVGSPVLHGSDFSTGGSLIAGKTGLGEKAVFEREIPVMHVAMLRGLRADLARRKVSADSITARKAGLMVDKTMGFVNQELKNFDPRSQKALSDIALAPQFTRSKWELLTAAITKGGKEGNLARRAVIGKYTAEAAIILGLSYAFQQKSDSIRDMLLRALVHPSVPTPFKDSKGNTIEVGLPQNYVSEAASLGITLERHSNGHLGINISPANLPSNLENYGRSRLSVIPAALLKLRTNTDYAGKPLYDPTAPAGTKAEQAGTVLAGDLMPIATQGILETKAVNKHLPTGVQEVLNADSPGSNPIVKSVASSFGGTVRTDKTTGKGQQTTQYYAALDHASHGLDQHEMDAFDMYTGGKKNPVTGKYQVLPNVNDERAKATALLDNPKVINNLIAMNKTLAAQGQAVDPLWKQPADKIVKVLQLQAMNPDSSDPQTSNWHTVNDKWYRPLSTARSAFFDTLPPGDPNKPPAPVAYPEPSAKVSSEMTTYFNMPIPSNKQSYITAHPELQKQFDAQDAYYAKLLPMLGYGAYKGYPKATPAVESYITTYSAADKATKKAMRNSNPTQYQAMIAYFDNADLYAIDQQGGKSAIQGQPDDTSKELKSISSVAQDVYQNPDGSYSLVPAGWMNGLSNGFDSSFTYKPAQVHFPTPKFGHTHLKKSSIGGKSNAGIALFNSEVKGANKGIKLGGGKNIKIAP